MWRFDRSQLWTLCPALALLVLTAGLSFRNWLEFQDARAAEEASRAMLSHANRLLTLVKDAETGQRGYLLTGNNLYLEPYERALPDISNELVALDARPNDTTIAHLNEAVRGKMDELAETIELRRRGDADRALAIVESGRGQEEMNRIRTLVAQLVAEEVSRAGTRSEQAQSHANRLGVVGTGGLLLTCVLLMIAILQLTRVRVRESETRNLLAATLASIGDAVITTDARGGITFLNPVAEELTGWSGQEAAGKKLDQVFRIVNQRTRQPVESPASKVLREGCVVGLANHTVLIARNGIERPIDDSGAPIRDANSNINGVVLVFRDVTERYDTQSALEASEQRYRMLFENNPQPMWIFDEDTYAFLDVNQAAVEAYGYTREEFLSMTLRDIRPSEEMPALLNDLRRRRSTRHSDGPWLHRKKDGSIMVVEITSVPIEVAGRPCKFVCTTDVTARVEAEKALKRSEEQYRAIVETASDAIITIDEDSKIMFASAPVEQIFGCQPAALIGRSVTELMPEPLRAAHLAGFRRYLATNQKHTSWKLLELPGRRQDGGEVPLELSFGEFRSEGKRWFTGVIRDVSERRRDQEKLRETRALMQTVFDTVPLAIWGIDLLGRVIFWNRVAESMFQWSEAEVRDQRLPIIPVDQTEQFNELLAEYATGSQLSGVERTRVRKDGSVVRCSIWTAPLRTGSGSIIGTVGVLADVTERRRLEKETRDHLNYLARFQRDLEQFAWAASHDLEEPLRLVSTNNELIRQRYLGYLPAEGKQLLKNAETAAVHARNLAGALREYWEVQNRTLVMQTISLDTVVGLAVQRLHPRLVSSAATVHWNDLPSITGDQELLLELFVRLLDNAIKFRSETPPEIYVTSESSSGCCTIRVQDNGIGMKPEHTDRPFGIFYKLSDEAPGSGIGLSVCRQIMQRHGGTISLVSEPGAGTTVYLEFAAGGNTESEPAPRSTAARASSGGAGDDARSRAE